QPDDRWQLTLNDGKTLWELHLVQLKDDTLVVRHAESTYRLAIAQVDELRLVRKSEHRTNEPGRYGDALGGAADQVYRLTLYRVSERRQILAQVFKDHPPAVAAAPAGRGADPADADRASRTMIPGRRILLADADAFYVAVARLVDPHGAGMARLLIVGGAPERRGVVTSASYEARAFGVHSAMPM